MVAQMAMVVIDIVIVVVVWQVKGARDPFKGKDSKPRSLAEPVKRGRNRQVRVFVCRGKGFDGSPRGPANYSGALILKAVAEGPERGGYQGMGGPLGQTIRHLVPFEAHV